MAGRHQVLHWRHNGRNNVMDQERRISPEREQRNQFNFREKRPAKLGSASPPSIFRQVG
jgi:hypothetical protein